MRPPRPPHGDAVPSGGPPSLGGRTLRGLAWASSGSAARAVLQVLVLAILARLVTPHEFGVLAAALVVVGLTAIFQHLGVGPALVQRETLEPRHLRVGVTLTVLLGATLSLALWGAAPRLAAFFRFDELPAVLRAVSLVFVLQSPSVVPAAMLQRELDFRRLAWTEVAAYGVGYGLVGTVLAVLGAGVWALVAAYLTQALVTGVVLPLVRPVPARPSLDLPTAAELMTFGTGFTLARVFNQLAVEGDALVAGRYLGAEALGVYGRAHQLMATPAVLLGTVLDKVLFPSMAQVQHRRATLAEVYRHGVGIVALAMAPLSAVVVVVAPDLVRVLLGEAWTAVVLPLRVFAVGMLLRTSYKLSDSLARATGAVYRRAWRQGAYAAAVLAGAWIGRRWGVPGVAAGVLAALSLNYLLMAQLGLRLTGLAWTSFLGVQARALPATLVASGAAWAATVASQAVNAPAPLALAGALLAAAAATVGASVRWPGTFLGGSGRWMVRTVGHELPGALGRRLASLGAAREGGGAA